MNNEMEATDKQYALMEKLGIEYDPRGVSLEEAKSLIKTKIESRKPKDITQNYTEPSLKKDTLIVRQSCLKAAVECYRGITPIDMKNVEFILKVSEEFEKWVFR